MFASDLDDGEVKISDKMILKPFECLRKYQKSGPAAIKARERLKDFLENSENWTTLSNMTKYDGLTYEYALQYGLFTDEEKKEYNGDILFLTLDRAKLSPQEQVDIYELCVKLDALSLDSSDLELNKLKQLPKSIPSTKNVFHKKAKSGKVPIIPPLKLPWTPM